MTLVMKNKVDVYLKHPERFQLDLLNQKSIWMDNVVRPLGSHYEASKKQIDTVLLIADDRRKKHAAALAKIQLIQDIAMGILLVGVDIIAAGAMRNVSLLSKKFSSAKSFDQVLDSSSSFEAAVKSFFNQKTTFTDAIVANFDDKIKGLVSTGTAKSAIKTGKALTAKISTKMPLGSNVTWSGPQKFQNTLETFYSTTCRLINEQFVNLVRDSAESETFKKSVVEYFVNLPFVMPPTLSLNSFEAQFANYFELCYWIRLIEQTSKAKGNFGLLQDRFNAETINGRIYALTGRQLTNTGGKIGGASGIKTLRGLRVATYFGQGSQYWWRGYCSGAQNRYGNSIVKAGGQLINPFFISQGISCQQAYK